MNSTFMRFISAISLGSMILVFHCSNPTSDSVHWMSNFEIPVTNDKFFLAEQFPNFFSNATLNPNDTTPGKLLIDTTKDTVSFEAPSRDTTRYTISEDSLETKTYSNTLGAIPISNAPDINETIPYTAPQLTGTSLSVPSLNLRLKKVYHLLFSASSGPLTVTLTNTSTNAALSNVSLSIGSLGTQVAASIGASGSTVLSFPVSGKSIDGTVSVSLSATLSSANPQPAGAAGLGLAFSINGLKADSLIVDDSLISFNVKYSNDYTISDTVNIDFIDLDYGVFKYSLANGSKVHLKVKAEHRDVWIEPFCISKHWNHLSDLADATSADSSAYLGAELTNGGFLSVGPDSIIQFHEINMSGRMFTEWEPDSGRSVSWVDYYVTSDPHPGTIDTISANDQLSFNITPEFIQFQQLQGTLAQAYVRKSDTQYVPINFPWPSSSRDSLRGKFKLKKVSANLSINISLPVFPDTGFIDTAELLFHVFDPGQPGDPGVDTQITLYNVMRDSSFHRIVDVTRVINLFPDSVGISAELVVPTGTQMRIVNDVPIDSSSIAANRLGSMTLESFTKDSISAQFSWEVDDTARLDLGNSDFTLGSWTTIANKLTGRKLDFNMTVYNHTNVYIRLYGLLLPGISKDTLDHWDSTGYLNTAATVPLLAEPQSATPMVGQVKCVNLLGPNGVLIPPRDSTVTDSITLDESQLEVLFGDTTCGAKWQMQFLPYNPVQNDALADTDYIKINSSLHLTGINSMDSLTRW